jgi:hypothetical protein
MVLTRGAWCAPFNSLVKGLEREGETKEEGRGRGSGAISLQGKMCSGREMSRAAVLQPEAGSGVSCLEVWDDYWVGRRWVELSKWAGWAGVRGQK